MKTDQELARRTRVATAKADKVVKRARRRAADVVRTARECADGRMRRRKSSNAERTRVEAERSQEDQTLRKEYARADNVTATERAERARLIAELLRQERRDTDRSLLLERADADAIVARRDEFLGMVSHDLRNELSGIGLSVGLMLKYAGDDESGRKVFRAATNVQRINLRMSRLLGDLLDVASIDVGKFTVVRADHDMSRTVNDVIESFGPLASAKGISLATKGLDQPLVGCVDHQRIHQVLGNLLTNALKHTPEGGRVTVCVERKRDKAWLVVRDTGSGIAGDRLGAIFDRFSRGARPDHKGLGLGLYIARIIVEAHGGRIWADSEPGRGSTFSFTLPLRPAEPPSLG